MATVKPFSALRPRPELAAQVCAPPYDVLSSEEARLQAGVNPLSFLHVSKPEIDLGPGVDPYSDVVYQTGRKNFQCMIGDGVLRRDPRPCYHLYRQIMGGHAQVGLVAAVGCQDYADQVVKQHELTLARKEDDRVRHIETLGAQTGPAFLVYRANPAIAALIEACLGEPPEVDFTADDGVRHSAWTVGAPEKIDALDQAFAGLRELYIADGHHRTAAAVRIWKTRAGSGRPSAAGFLAVLFPHDQVQILPCNRLVRDLQGRSASAFADELRKLGSWQAQGDGRPSRPHEIGVFLDGRWHRFGWKDAMVRAEDRAGRLDVALLQKHVLAPLLGIDNPRTAPRISFAGGIRGTGELEKAVRSGEFAVAFSLHPVQVEDVMAIVDQGGMMPPKSTWFEPKLRDGMFSLMLD